MSERFKRDDPEQPAPSTDSPCEPNASSVSDQSPALSEGEARRGNQRYAELEMAVEAHKRGGEELGGLYRSNKLTATEVLDRAAELDDVLYTTLDEIQIDGDAWDESGREALDELFEAVSPQDGSLGDVNTAAALAPHAWAEVKRLRSLSEGVGSGAEECHDLVDISNGTTLINVSKCRRCGAIVPTQRGRTTVADFDAARSAAAPPPQAVKGGGCGRCGGSSEISEPDDRWCSCIFNSHCGSGVSGRCRRRKFGSPEEAPGTVAAAPLVRKPCPDCQPEKGGEGSRAGDAGDLTRWILDALERPADDPSDRESYQMQQRIEAAIKSWEEG